MAALDHLTSMLNGVSRLVEQHLKLARLELKADVRAIGTRVGIIAGLLPLVLVGYGFLCAALALFLARSMAMEAAFAVVGALNVLLAGLGILIAGRQLADRPVLEATLTELEATTAAVRGGPEPEGGS